MSQASRINAKQRKMINLLLFVCFLFLLLFSFFFSFFLFFFFLFLFSLSLSQRSRSAKQQRGDANQNIIPRTPHCSLNLASSINTSVQISQM